MSSSIDQRIVSMKFDNKQFESGAKESIQTLDNLKKTIDTTSSNKSLTSLGETLTNSTKGFSVAHVENQLNSLGRGFNALEVVAITAISNITTLLMNKLGKAFSSTLGQIYSGGLKRAQNLEQANFSMMGLLGDAEEVSKIMGKGGPVQSAVDGTAYGLDQAALAASNLVATGLKTEELEKPLKTISGLAAQTGRDYSMMADVITDSYAKGYASNMEISRLQEQGINAFAELKKYYKEVKGVEYEVDELFKMASKKAISAEDFADSLYHFYENAARANETYSGSLSNLKAALSRIGEKLETPKLQNMTKIFNALRTMINEINKAIDPVIMGLVEISNIVTKFSVEKIAAIEAFFKNINSGPKPDIAAKGLKKVANGVAEISQEVNNLNNVDALNGVGDAIYEITESTKPDIAAKGLKQVSDNIDLALLGIDKVAETDRDLQREAEGLSNPFKRLAKTLSNLYYSFLNIGSAFKTFFSRLKGNIDSFDFFKNLRPITLIIEEFSVKILNLSNRFKEFIDSSSSVSWVINTISYIFRSFLSVVNVVYDLFKEFGGFLVNGIVPIFKIFLKSISDIINVFESYFFKVITLIDKSEIIHLVFNKLSLLFSNVLKPILTDILIRFGLIGSHLGPSSPLVKALDFFYGLIEKVVNILVKWLKTDTDFDGWTNTITNALDKISSFLSPVGEGFTKLKDKVTGFFKGLVSESEGYTIFEKLTGLLEKAGNILSKVGTKISEAFKTIGEGIRNAFTGPNLTSAAGAVAIFGAGGIAYKIFDFIKRLAEDQGLGAFEAILRNLDLASRKLIGVFTLLQENLQTKAMKEIATAILIFAAAIFVLSTIEPSRLAGATAAITVAVVELTSAFTTLSTLFSAQDKNSLILKSTSRGGMPGLAAALIAFSAAVLIIAAAMKSLSSLSWDEIGRGTVALNAIFALLITYVAMIENIAGESASIVKGSSSLIGLAIAIGILTIAVKKLGEMDVETLMKGLTSVGLLLTGLMIFTKFGEANNMGFSSGAGILLLSAALLVLTNVIKTLGSLDPNQLVQGLLSIGVALGGIAIFINMLEGTNPISAAAGLLLAAAALVVIANAIKKLTEFDSVALSVSLGMMLIALGGITLALSILEQTSSMTTAVSLLIVASAVAALAEAFLILALVPADRLAIGLLAMLAALVGIGAAAWLLEPVAGIMLIVAGAMTLFGVGVLAIAAAMAILTPVMVAFSVALIGSLEVLLTGILTMQGQLSAGLTALITSFLDAIIAVAPKIKEAFIVVMTAVIEGFVELFEIIVQAIVDLISAIAVAMVELIPLLADAAVKIIFGILTVIRDNIFEFVVIGMEIVTEFINGIAEALPDLIDAGFNLIISFIEGLAKAIDENAEDLGRAAWLLVEAFFTGIGSGFAGFWERPLELLSQLGSDMLDALEEYVNIREALSTIGEFLSGIWEGITNAWDTVYTAVSDIASGIIDWFKEHVNFENALAAISDWINGIVDGITGFAGRVIDTVSDFGSSILDGFCSFFGINSPSTVMTEVGQNLVEGLNIGLEDNEEPIETSKGLCERFFDSFKETFSEQTGLEFSGDLLAGINAGLSDTTSTGEIETNTSSIIEMIKSQLDKQGDFESIGQNLIGGLSVGISKGTPKAVEEAGSSANSIVARTKRAFAVQSPSRVFMAIGEYCMEGLANGFDETNDVEQKIKSLKDLITNSLESKLGVDDVNPTITPVLDLSGIQNGMNSIDGMFDKNYGILGSIAGGITNKRSFDLTDSITKLTDKLSARMNTELTPDDIYDAIREGAANARFTVMLNGRDITSVVNENNAETQATRLSYFGG